MWPMTPGELFSCLLPEWLHCQGRNVKLPLSATYALKPFQFRNITLIPAAFCRMYCLVGSAKVIVCSSKWLIVWVNPTRFLILEKGSYVNCAQFLTEKSARKSGSQLVAFTSFAWMLVNILKWSFSKVQLYRTVFKGSKTHCFQSTAIGKRGCSRN